MTIWKNGICYAIVFFLCPILFSGCGGVSQSIRMAPADIDRNECVILLHGLGRTSRSMAEMQDALIEAGFHTVNFGYPARKKTIEKLADEYIPKAIGECQDYDPERIHFVTHSLGGIVVRMALKHNKPENLGRVVMLSPPNRGSEAADIMQKNWLFTWFNGPAGQQLSTSSDSVPNQLGPVDYPVGIIMGDRQTSFDAWVASLYTNDGGDKVFAGANDGKISVERAKLAGMTDFIVVPENHSFLMNSGEVQFQTIEFLKNEAFRHENSLDEENGNHP